MDDGTELDRESSAVRFSDCRVCEELWRYLTDRDQGDLWHCSYLYIDADDCPRHAFLQEAFWSYCREKNVEYGHAADASWGRVSCDFEWNDDPQGIARMVNRGGERWTATIALMAQEHDEDDKIRRPGRRLDLNWIDLDLVRKWKADCLTNHGAVCEDSLASLTDRPRWLIDIELNCVVPGFDARSYVALSYLWGKTAQFRMKKEHLPESQKLNGLRDLPIARTILDAIDLTREIGERFLWVDALCIAQDDEELASELEKMGAIYANAVLVIVATGADAQTGLAGLRSVGSPRELRQWSV